MSTPNKPGLEVLDLDNGTSPYLYFFYIQYQCRVISGLMSEVFYSL